MTDLAGLTAAAGWVAVIAAGVAGAVYLARLAAKGFRAVSTMAELVERELQPNHGSSIKDDVHGMAVALGITQRRLDQVERDVQHLQATIDRSA